MGHFEKFLFETSFDSDKLREAKAREAKEAAAKAAEAEAEPEPPAPTFSEEELEAARREAHADGKAEGLAEAEKSQMKRLNDAVSALQPQFETLAQDVRDKEDDRRRESLDAAVTVVRKLFPQLARECGLEEIRAVVESCLERLRDEPRLVVRSADQDLDALKARIEEGVARGGFEGKIVYLVDERIAPGDVRVEWADGGAERDQKALWAEIDTVIARALSPAQPAPAQPAGQAAAAKDGQTVPAGTESQSQPQTSAEIEPLRRAQFA